MLKLNNAAGVVDEEAVKGRRKTLTGEKYCQFILATFHLHYYTFLNELQQLFDQCGLMHGVSVSPLHHSSPVFKIKTISQA